VYTLLRKNGGDPVMHMEKPASSDDIAFVMERGSLLCRPTKALAKDRQWFRSYLRRYPFSLTRLEPFIASITANLSRDIDGLRHVCCGKVREILRCGPHGIAYAGCNGRSLDREFEVPCEFFEVVQPAVYKFIV
jgi:hypothetical protein